MNPKAVVSSLLASKLRVALVAVLVAGVGVGGAFAVGVLGVPGIADIDNAFGNVTDETTIVETDLVVSNPNPIGVSLDGLSVDYTVSMNSVEMATGSRDGVSIGSGNSTLELETRMRNEAIPPWWTSHIRNDERTTVDIDATVHSALLGRSTDLSRSREIETDLIGAFSSDDTRPVNASSPLADDPVLYINETRGEWGEVSDSETPIDMEFDVYNPNLEPYAVSEIGYEITMNGVAMGEGRTRDGYVIESYSSETVELTTTIENQRLDEWWVTHLDEGTYGHQVSQLRIDFYAIVELPTGDTITVPLDELTYEETIETDIFGEGDSGSSAGTDESDGERSGEGSTSTATQSGDSGETETVTETETDSETETVTELEPTATETTETDDSTDTDDDGSGDDDGGLLSGT
jgi:LEA14-like dessication related protein